jgi:hypothetical protein
MRTFSILLLSILLAGCASLDVSYVGPMPMAKVKNTSWYLFDFIPLGTGNPDKPNSMSFKLFTNLANVNSNMKMLSTLIERENATTVSNITSIVTDEKIFIVLFNRHTCQTSAELIK